MKEIWILLKKELKRIFTDNRMLLSLFLPGILMFVIYSLVGTVFQDAFTKKEVFNDVTYNIAYSDNNTDPEVRPYIISAYSAYLAVSEDEKTNKAVYSVLPSTSLEEIKVALSEGTYDVYIQFSDNFDELTKDTNYTSQQRQHIDIYYNGSSKTASRAYSVILSLADSTYRNFLVNIDGDMKPIQPNVSPKNAEMTKVISIIVPMMALMVTFSSVLTLTPDTIAGEKERGTLGIMLLTPINRTSIVFAKLFSTIITAFVGGLVTCFGLIFGLNKMMGNLFTSVEPAAIVLLAVMVITATILFVTIGLLMSALTKSAKEANAYMIPVMIFVLIAALMTSMVDVSALWISFVPVLNVAACISLSISSSLPIANLLITVAINILLSVSISIIIGQLFKNENLMIK